MATSRYEDIKWEYVVSTHYYENDAGITVEDLYQEFKARLINELTYTGQIMEPLRGED